VLRKTKVFAPPSERGPYRYGEYATRAEYEDALDAAVAVWRIEWRKTLAAELERRKKQGGNNVECGDSNH